jgi:hypothetical protein
LTSDRDRGELEVEDWQPLAALSAAIEVSDTGMLPRVVLTRDESEALNRATKYANL